MRRKFLRIFLVVTCAISFTACGNTAVSGRSQHSSNDDVAVSMDGSSSASSVSSSSSFDATASDQTQAQGTEKLSVPAYTGNAYAVLNNNTPDFSTDELAKATSSYITLSDLDSEGRCGTATESIGRDMLPSKPRGEIGSVKPTGWHTIKYSDIDGRYLYNRCHLLGYQYSGLNAEERNLITGTRYLNIEGMLPFENQVTDEVKETGKHVLIRVTPHFEGNNLLSTGVQMEAESVEDSGADVSFNVFCYNVQPGIGIDYATGDSWQITESKAAGSQHSKIITSGGTINATVDSSVPTSTSQSVTQTYILNTKTKKFHMPGCVEAARISDKNLKETIESKDKLIQEGYEPCGVCKP